MILGRPTNLWMGLITSFVGLIALIGLLLGADPTAVAQLSASITLVLGALVVLVANGPAAVNVGDQYTVVTPNGQDNVQKIANSNPTPPSLSTPK